MPARAWLSMPFCLVSSMRLDSDSDLVFNRFDRAARHRLGDGGANFGQRPLKAAIDGSTALGCCSASIWLVILKR